MSCNSLLACRDCAERSAVNLIGTPLYVICCFSLAAFNIFNLYLIFDSLINMYLGLFLLGFILYGTLCYLDLIDYFLSQILDVFNYNFFNYFLSYFLFSSSSGTPIVWIVVCLMLSQRSLGLSSMLFILFSLFFSVVVISTILSSRSLILSSASVFLLLIPSREFLFRLLWSSLFVYSLVF